VRDVIEAFALALWVVLDTIADEIADDPGRLVLGRLEAIEVFDTGAVRSTWSGPVDGLVGWRHAAELDQIYEDAAQEAAVEDAILDAISGNG
jgi:hypothetical protein